MPTKFDQDHKDFTDKAHLKAQELIYPVVFNCDVDRLSFEDVDIKTDMEDKIDRVVRVRPFCQNLHDYGIKFTIQERFREPWYKEYRDITITEWNNATNYPSELYDITADFFVYGYYDEIDEEFGEWICIDVSLYKMLVCSAEEVNLEVNPKNQNFITHYFDELVKVKNGLVVHHHTNGIVPPKKIGNIFDLPILTIDDVREVIPEAILELQSKNKVMAEALRSQARLYKVSDHEIYFITSDMMKKRFEKPNPSTAINVAFSNVTGQTVQVKFFSEDNTTDGDVDALLKAAEELGGRVLK